MIFTMCNKFQQWKRIKDQMEKEIEAMEVVLANKHLLQYFSFIVDHFAQNKVIREQNPEFNTLKVNLNNWIFNRDLTQPHRYHVGLAGV